MLLSTIARHDRLVNILGWRIWRSEKAYTVMTIVFILIWALGGF